MSAEVALIGFPRLQEQIATRLLAEHDVTIQSVTPDDAVARMSMFNLALYFWPEGGDLTAARLKAVRAGTTAEACPILIVTSQTGKFVAQNSIGEDAQDIILTPLQPHDISQKLAKYAGLSKPKEKISVDADYINPFVSATVDTLKTMAGMECERTGLRLSPDAKSTGFYSGTIGLSGNAEGSVSVTFSKELAKKIVCKMLSMPEEEITDDDVRDAVGEFMNVVAGAAKKDLVDSQNSFNLSLPQVFSGGPHVASQPRGIPVFVIEFSADGDPFDVLVALRKKKA